jgi:D-alanine-D-alanine ligase-like ATP-grasp enzyme
MISQKNILKYINKSKYKLILLFFILLFIFFYLFKNIHFNDFLLLPIFDSFRIGTHEVEHYRGLSKVQEFENILKKKYSKVDTENKVVTHCIKKVTVHKNEISQENEETVENNCKSLTYKYHFNSEDAVKLVKDKIETSQILEKNDIPVPKFFKFTFDPKKDNIDNFERFKSQMNQNKINFPIVMKQIHGTFGIDVYTHIDNNALIKSTLQLFQDKGYSELMCEEQIEGHCYRIFVFNNKIMDVIKREAPYVIGDGVNTLRSLIDMRNKKQLEKGLFETKNVSESYIKKNGNSMDSIIPKGKNVIISTVINMHNGANISRIPISVIPKINKDIFIKTNEVLGIMTSGIDFLSKDISIPYDQNNGRILEINGTPDTEIHTIVSKQNSDGFNIYESIANNVFN